MSEGGRIGADFESDARAPSIFYTLEVLQMPRAASSWTEFSEKLLLDRAIKEHFQENQVINQLE